MVAKPHLIQVRIPQRDYDLLDKELKAIAPQRRLGFPKNTILSGVCKAMVIALHRPNHYPIAEMIHRMCLAAVRPDDTEAQEMIENLFK